MVWLLLTVDVRNTCSQHKLLFLVLLVLVLLVLVLDFTTLLFTILLFSRMFLKSLFLLYAIMGWRLLKAFAIFELMPRMFLFLRSILPIDESVLF